MHRLLLPVLTLALACNGDEDTESDNAAPLVILVRPLDNAAFKPDSPVEVCLTVDDETPVGQLAITLASDVDGELVAEEVGCAQGDLGYAITLSDARHELTVTATDTGDNSGSDSATLFPVPNSDPLCAFTAPPPNTTVVVGTEVQFAATALDDSTPLDEIAATMVSDIDGTVWSGSPDATGAIATASTPSAGTHLYTLTVTDDTDKVGTCTRTLTVLDCQDVDSDGVTNCDGDCDDDDGDRYPGNDETVGDGIDQDCNGFDTVSCWTDNDGDGYGIQVAVLAPDGLCETAEQESYVAGDCADNDDSRYPGAPEIPDDGIDQDCNDTDTITCILDDDADGYGNAPGTTIGADDGACDTQQNEATNNADCDDTDGTVYPNAPELCDGQLDACGGTMLAGETDADGDQRIACTLDPGGWDGPGTVVAGIDCDTSDGTVFEGATELCDGQDNDCDFTIPGVETDSDSDGWVACTLDAGGWDGPPGVVGGDDCDPAVTEIHPGATELCDGLHNDCNGWVGGNPVLPEPETDADGDGYVECVPPPGNSGLSGGDCDDTVAGQVDVNGNPIPGAQIYPGRQDPWHDGIDQNCDGDNDFDADNDLFVLEGFETWANGDAPYTGDCNDFNGNINPDATEIWYDGIDQNCDFWSDFDQDFDGEDCDGSALFASCGSSGSDCDDTDPSIPGTEVFDVVDNDCDGMCDEGFIGEGALMINEVMSYPDLYCSPWEYGQYLEVINTTSQTIRLCEGWRLYSDWYGNWYADPQANGFPLEIAPGDTFLFLATSDDFVNGGIYFEPDRMMSWDLNWGMYPDGGYEYLAIGFDGYAGGDVDYTYDRPWDHGRSSALDPQFIDYGPPYGSQNDDTGAWCFSYEYYFDPYCGSYNEGTPGFDNYDVYGCGYFFP